MFLVTKIIFPSPPETTLCFMCFFVHPKASLQKGCGAEGIDTAKDSSHHYERMSQEVRING